MKSWEKIAQSLQTCIPQHPQGNSCTAWGFECCEWVFVLRRNPTRWNLGEQFFEHVGKGSRSWVGPGFGPFIVHKRPQVFASARRPGISEQHKHQHHQHHYQPEAPAASVLGSTSKTWINVLGTWWVSNFLHLHIYQHFHAWTSKTYLTECCFTYSRRFKLILIPLPGVLRCYKQDCMWTCHFKQVVAVILHVKHKYPSNQTSFDSQ